jgi:hypothetical protein
VGTAGDGAPTSRSEADDLRLIVDYLGIRPSSLECRRITGLSKTSISDLLHGNRKGSSRRRTHIATVAEIVAILSAARLAATGESTRGPWSRWLHVGQIRTSTGVRTPLEVLSDDALAREILADLQR